MKKRILLVASENDIVDSFPVALGVAGYDVELAPRGLPGINLARVTAPDLVVIDTALPDMDGPTAEGILRRLPSTASIPTLLLKPRGHKLMPFSVSTRLIQSGLIQSMNPADLVSQVETTLAHYVTPVDALELAEVPV